MSKSNVAIVIDSTANIPLHLIKKHNLYVMPLRINWPGEDVESEVDAENITSKQFYKKLKSSSAIPSTSQPSPGEFVEFFKEIGEKHSEIVVILVSNQLSGTYKSATFALNMVEELNIQLIDSKTMGIGMGLIAMNCADMAKSGKSIDEIAQFAREGAEDERTWIVVDTLDYLHKGGRVSGSKKLVGNILNMKPILNINNGKAEIFGAVRTRKKAIDTILDMVETEMQNGKRFHMGISHADDPVLAHETATMVRERFLPEVLHIADMSPVVGTHTGPGALSISHLIMHEKNQ